MYKDSMYFSEICFVQMGGREILVYKNSKEKKNLSKQKSSYHIWISVLPQASERLNIFRGGFYWLTRGKYIFGLIATICTQYKCNTTQDTKNTIPTEMLEGKLLSGTRD